jgi:serine phosphatase RsbU (regulator of sigma subunit)
MSAIYFVIASIYIPRSDWAVAWLAIYATILALTAVIRAAETRRTRGELVLEYRSREAEIRLTTARFEREVELAREIQDSMAPPTRQLAANGAEVLCLQQKHEGIAGDWLATRECKDGRLIFVTADATGKGLQAALVVHAIQSLWATTLDQEDFDPGVWLARVNQALFRLGRTQSHSATIGVAILDRSRITYWSAGHPPLFVMIGPEPACSFLTLHGRGSLLGLAEDLEVLPTWLSIHPGMPLRMVMGSDGVLPRGTRTTRRDIEQLSEGLRAEGAAFLGTLEVDDDKSVILVERGMPAVGSGDAPDLAVSS